MKFSRFLAIFCVLSILLGGGYAVFYYMTSNPKPTESKQIDKFDDLREYVSLLRAELKTMRMSDDDGSDLKNKRALEKKLERIEAEVTTLQKQLQIVLDTVSALQREDTALQVGEVEEKPDLAPFTESDMTHTEQESKDLEREYFSRIDLSFGAESFDMQWSSTTTNLIEQAFESEELTKAAVLDVECRSTLCRVEVEHENHEDMSGFELWFPHKVADALSSFTMQHEERGDGGITTVIYMARAGFRLPAAE